MLLHYTESNSKKLERLSHRKKLFSKTIYNHSVISKVFLGFSESFNFCIIKVRHLT